MRAGIFIVALIVSTWAGLVSAKAPAASAGAHSTPAALSELRERALGDPLAMRLLESLTSEIGARQAGSEKFVRARDWAIKNLQALGFQNVHTEPFTLNAWTRVEERAQIVAPYPQKLAIIGLGGTTPTPTGGLDGEIVLFRKYAALLEAPTGSHWSDGVHEIVVQNQQPAAAWAEVLERMNNGLEACDDNCEWGL